MALCTFTRRRWLIALYPQVTASVVEPRKVKLHVALYMQSVVVINYPATVSDAGSSCWLAAALRVRVTPTAEGGHFIIHKSVQCVVCPPHKPVVKLNSPVLCFRLFSFIILHFNNSPSLASLAVSASRSARFMAWKPCRPFECLKNVRTRINDYQ